MSLRNSAACADSAGHRIPQAHGCLPRRPGPDRDRCLRERDQPPGGQGGATKGGYRPLPPPGRLHRRPHIPEPFSPSHVGGAMKRYSFGLETVLRARRPGRHCPRRPAEGPDGRHRSRVGSKQQPRPLRGNSQVIPRRVLRPRPARRAGGAGRDRGARVPGQRPGRRGRGYGELRRYGSGRDRAGAPRPAQARRAHTLRPPRRGGRGRRIGHGPPRSPGGAPPRSEGGRKPAVARDLCRRFLRRPSRDRPDPGHPVIAAGSGQLRRLRGRPAAGLVDLRLGRERRHGGPGPLRQLRVAARRGGPAGKS